MGDRLNIIFDNLKQIRSYIVKLNYERRKSPILQTKITEAKEVYAELNREITLVNEKIQKSEVDNEEILLIKELVEKIKNLYKEILTFGEKRDTAEGLNMGSFDLKVAVGLIPIMDDTEETTNKLIDALDLYSSMLNDEGKKTLIKFVLKTRLSQNAKIRLNSNYDEVNDLLGDIKTHLLTKKSDTALQAKLFSSKQGSKSVVDFGKEIENLFVDLTISQADGNTNSYNVLRPINEKAAIKRFAEGLRSQKLSTIIASRNFNFLKDAIRAAQDEESSSSTNEFSHVMTMFRRDRGRGNYRNFHRGSVQNRNFQNNYGNRHSINFQNNNRVSNNNTRYQQFPRNSRGRSFTRGNSNTRGSRPVRHSMHFAEPTDVVGQDHTHQETHNDSQEFSTFFRS